MDEPPDATVTTELRVMVVGDSISHGREGDWTWRYRIWQWFQQQHIPLRFVGPYTGTVPPEEPHPPRPPPLDGEATNLPPRASCYSHGGYADDVEPGFLANSHHFAWSGRQAFDMQHLIAEQVAAHQPDLCLVELGFNDLGWRMASPLHVIGNMKHLIDEARSAKPDVKFAIANIPHRTHMSGREDLPINTDAYNKMLARCLPYWSTPTSPLALVRFCENYSCGGTNSDAAYDGLHPNALGEYQLAQAFSRTLLTSFHLGRTELTLPNPIPARPLPAPTTLRATTTPDGIVATWPAVYGAYGYDVQHRTDPAATDDWSLSHVESNRHDFRPLRRGQRVECRVRTSGGDFVQSEWSEVVSAVAEPQTAPPPANITTHATKTGFVVQWDPVSPGKFRGEFNRYGVTVFDGDLPGAYPYARGVRGTRAEFGDQPKGHRFFVSVETWTSMGGGIPAGARAVRVGAGGAPPSPREVRARAVDEHTAEISWQEVHESAGYGVYWRKVGDPETEGGSLQEVRVMRDEGSDGEGRVKATHSLFWPSVWDWKFAVIAYNGNDNSERSEWVTTPRWAEEEVSLAETDSIRVALRHG